MHFSILVAARPLNVHAGWLANAIARLGHDVDLLLWRSNTDMVDMDRFFAPDVRVRVIDAAIAFENLQEAASSEPYDVVIGIEKRGLVWAERLSRLCAAELWYYSLEIYLEDHPRRAVHAPLGLRLAEIGAMGQATVTVIQDEDRWAALCAANQALVPGSAAWFDDPAKEVHHLPVSVEGSPVTEPLTWLHDRLGIPHDKKIVLYFGHIAGVRMVKEVTWAAAALPSSHVLVLHGAMRGDAGELAPNFHYSPPNVPVAELWKVIASAAVGLAFYDQGCANNKLTAFSSEKVARYAQCGVPFIAFDNDSYRRLRERHDCCVLVERPEDFVDAVVEIEARAPAMRQACLEAFREIYDFAIATAFLPGAVARVEARRKQARPARPAVAGAPLVSVVVPTRDRADQLYTLLRHIFRQSLAMERFELIVVDNGSTDHTADVCTSMTPMLPNMRVIHDPRPGLMVGRHAGLAEARADVVVFCDDDIIPDRGWLEAYVEAFADPRVALAGGPALPAFEATPPAWIKHFVRDLPVGGSTISHLSLIDMGSQARPVPPRLIYGCNWAARRVDLLAVGGFLPDGVPNELLRYRGAGETGTAERMVVAGFHAQYVPGARVQHVVPAGRLTLDYLASRGFSQGVSAAYEAIRYNRPVVVAPFRGQPTPEQTLWKQAHARGQAFVLNEALTDEALLKWITRPCYFDAPDLRTLPRGNDDDDDERSTDTR